MKNNYANTFEKYLNEEFKPAQEWAASSKGRDYISKMIPSLAEIKNKEDDVLAAVYEIKINSISVYIGQSLRTVRRLYTHACHLCDAPEEYFGIKQSEIQTIEMIILTPPILAEKARLQAEAENIKSKKPALQPYYNISGMHADACLPRGNARREAMINAGVIRFDA
jgi:hypothetical protein